RRRRRRPRAPRPPGAGRGGPYVSGAPTDRVVAYTDGSCDTGPGRGGWADLLVAGCPRRSASGVAPGETNNRTDTTPPARAVAAGGATPARAAAAGRTASSPAATGAAPPASSPARRTTAWSSRPPCAPSRR